MPTLVVRGLAGELPPLVNPDIARDYVYVDDVNDAYILAATQTDQEFGAVYNVGTGVQTSLRQVVNVARQVMPIAVEPNWGSMPDRRWDTSVWVSDNRRIQDALGWKPRYSFEQGLQQMVQWFQDHPEMHQFYSDRLAPPKT
jgi:dolichol-phosphate mannosyltransferase